MSTNYQGTKIYGWRELCEMHKISRCREAVINNLRRATFNPNSTDALIVALVAILGFGFMIMLAI